MVDRLDPGPGEILLDPACGTGGFLTCSLRHMRERYVKKSEHENAPLQAEGNDDCRLRADQAA
jgi:type I restriction enzyme M protein